MPSIAKEKRNGRTTYRLLWFGADRKTRFRHYLGAASKSRRNTLELHVQRLEIASMLSQPVEPATQKWVQSLIEKEPKLYQKLVDSGLVAAGKDLTLANAIEDFISKKTSDADNTIRNWRICKRYLTEYFGDNRLVSSITHPDALGWKEHLHTLTKKNGKPFAQATINKRVKRAKQIFKNLAAKQLITSNPFIGVTAGNEENPERQFFVTREMTGAMLGKCPNATVRLLLVLYRYGGMRQQEPFQLTWADVNLPNGTIRVTAPKTRKKKPYRVLPIFPEVRPYMEDVFEGADSQRVIDYDIHPSALYTKFSRIRERANVIAYDRLFHNMRGSRATELLAAGVAIADVSEWLGMDKITLLRHYAQATPQSMERAKTVMTGGPVEDVGQYAGHNSFPSAPTGSEAGKHDTKSPEKPGQMDETTPTAYPLMDGRGSKKPSE